MKVTQRFMRVKFQKILKEFTQKELGETRASGEDVECTEPEKIMTDITERIQECKLAVKSVKGKENNDRATAE